MYNVQARGVVTPNVVVGMALFVGGLAQFVAGMWEFATANTFGATGECLSYQTPPTARQRWQSCLTLGLIPSVHHVRRLLDVVRDNFPPRLWRYRGVLERGRA